MATLQEELDNRATIIPSFTQAKRVVMAHYSKELKGLENLEMLVRNKYLVEIKSLRKLLELLGEN